MPTVGSIPTGPIMEMIVTPITNREIDLHSPYRYDPDNLKDLYWMRENKEQLDKTQMKLYSWLIFSQSNFSKE